MCDAIKTSSFSVVYSFTIPSPFFTPSPLPPPRRTASFSPRRPMPTKRGIPMKAIIRKLSVSFVVFLAGSFSAFNAAAQCGTGAGDGHSTMNNASSALSRSVPLRASAKTPQLGSQDEHEGLSVSIVGFWHVVFTSQGTTNPPIPDGAVVDQGFSQWHSDNTEILNSSRPPVIGSFCLG